MRNNFTPTAGGIKRKVIFTLAAITATILLLSAALIYSIGFGMLKNYIGGEYSQLAQMLSTTAAEKISGEIEDIRSCTTRISWIKACETANLNYAGMDKKDIYRHMVRIDEEWAGSDSDSSLVSKYIENENANTMREILKIRRNISEMFLTDKYGGAVSASGKTSDFYQADEDWWQRSYNEGRGAIYVGDIEYDSSSSTWGIPIAVPMFAQNGEVAGILKCFISTSRVFDFIENFRIGHSGHAYILNGEGRMICHSGIDPLSLEAFEQPEFHRIIKTGFAAIYSSKKHEKNRLVAASYIRSETLFDNGVVWYAAISQDMGEAFRPLNMFILLILAVIVLGMLLVVPAGMVFGGLLTKPIDRLSDAARHIMSGELDYKIDIRTGDEIEQFADTFKNMIFALKENQLKIKRAKEDLEKLAANQESIIGERTGDLKKAQEATLNILEDLVEAKKNLERYAAKLEEALHLKTDFTATVSHELRTPLAAIKEGIEIIADGTAGRVNDQQKGFLDIAKRNVDRLTRIINDILDFQKLDAGRMMFDMKANDLNELVKEVGFTMSSAAASKGLDLSLDLEGGPLKANFDKDRITQALMNLVSNAIRYTDKGGIAVSTGRSGDCVWVSVKDTGIGIDRSEMPKLFERFTQLGKLVDRRPGGTGLGLAISKEIVEAHKGKIKIESEPGAGSTFTITLPIVR